MGRSGFISEQAVSARILRNQASICLWGKMKRQADTSWTRHRLLNCGALLKTRTDALLVTRTNAS